MHLKGLNITLSLLLLTSAAYPEMLGHVVVHRIKQHHNHLCQKPSILRKILLALVF